MAQEEQEMVAIYEERDETVVSVKDGKQSVRIARFLKPCVQDVNQAFKVPNTPLLSEIFSHSGTAWPSKVLFETWQGPQKKWEEWVDRLAGKYGAIWYQSNICDSILSSTYDIKCNRDLVLGLVEFWCSEVNTFVFPWGEATITLEDVMIIGGFSVTGEPVTSSLTEELVKIEEEMEKKRKELSGTRLKKTTHTAWLEYFMKEEGELEHVAFLALWLSRYVLPSLPGQTISKEVFPIAINLSRGKALALATAVLASLYKNLRLLKEQAVACKDPIIASGPLHLVQLWIFEHFPLLGPKLPNVLKLGEPRAARWHKQNPKISIQLIRSTMKVAESFQSRPYAGNLHNWRQLSYYKVAGDLVIDSLSSAAEFQSFLKCLVATELVGFCCRKKYVPHRVAMQFAMDQDIPGNYYGLESKNKNFRVLIAQSSFEPGVSKRYLDWWKELKLSREDAVKEILKQERTSTKIQEKIDEGNCKSTSNSSSSSEDVICGLASSNCDLISGEGTSNDKVSEPAAAEKDGDCHLMQDKMKIREESQASLHLDSSAQIKKRVCHDEDDDDDRIPLSARITIQPTSVERTNGPEADIQLENVAKIKVTQDKIDFSDDDDDIDDSGDDGKNEEEDKGGDDIDDRDDDEDDKDNSDGYILILKTQRPHLATAKQSSGSEEADMQAPTLNDSNITRKRNYLIAEGINVLAEEVREKVGVGGGLNRKAKKVMNEIIDLEDLFDLEDTSEEIDRSEVPKASAKSKSQKRKTVGCSLDNPINVDDCWT